MKRTRPSIRIIDQNPHVIAAVRRAIATYKLTGITERVGDATAAWKKNPKSVIVSASNPSFTMAGGLDAVIKRAVPKTCAKIVPGNGNQRIDRVLFTVTVDEQLRATADLVTDAITFALLNTRPSEALILTGLGTGIGGLEPQTFAEILVLAMQRTECFHGRTLYKVLVDGKSCHGGSLRWSLPKRSGKAWVPGAWQEVHGTIDLCSNGLHGTTDPYDKWMKYGACVYTCEAEDISGWDSDGKKFVARRMRLLREVPHPDWWTMTERFIREELPSIKWLQPDGKPKKEWKIFTGKTWSAARSAAWSAARSAAESAARSAAGSAAESAAESAARSAAGSAAESAAWSAAWSAARSAAESAARSAAESAAWSAALYARVSVCYGTKLAAKHVRTAEAEMEVWKKGYALAAEVGGVLYVYAKE